MRKTKVFCNSLKFKFLLFLIAMAPCVKSQTGSLNAVQKVLDEWQKDTTFTHASWGFKAINLTKKTVIAEYNAQKSLTPASVMKLVTVGTGFLIKSAASVFETQLQYTGTITQDSTLHGDIIIYGKGDPSLGSSRFNNQKPEVIFPIWAKALRDAGIKSIEGRIVADASYFDHEPYPDGWTWGDIGNYYGAGVYGLNFMDNEYKIFFRAGEKINNNAIISRIEPKITDVQFVSHVTIAAANSGDQTLIYSTPDATKCHIRGTIPLQSTEFSIRGAMPNPAKVLANSFYNYLIDNGVTISGTPVCEVIQAEKPTLFYTHNPIRYDQLAELTMMRSINNYAEAILLSLKSQKGASFKDNIRFLENYLTIKEISTSGFRMVDGSGLSRNNAISPEFLCDFLKMMNTTTSFQDFYNTIPVAGVSGTLSGMCKGTCAQNNLRAKSGTMSAVRAYAGYVNNSAGDLMCFSLIINNFNCKQSEMTKKIEKLFVALSGL